MASEKGLDEKEHFRGSKSTETKNCSVIKENIAGKPFMIEKVGTVLVTQEDESWFMRIENRLAAKLEALFASAVDEWLI